LEGGFRLAAGVTGRLYPHQVGRTPRHDLHLWCICFVV
jgi:hypothetical protein